MALEDIKRNAKRAIESDIEEYLKGKDGKSNYNYIVSKINLAESAALITIEETNTYLTQIKDNI